MEQMKIDEQYRVKLDTSEAWIPATVREFNPTVFKEGDSYCCILGPDPTVGIFGCGNSVQDAVKDWDEHLKELVAHHQPDDSVAQYVIDIMNASKNKIW